MSLNKIAEKIKKNHASEVKEATKVKPAKETPAPVLAEASSVVNDNVLPWSGPVTATAKPVKERDENGVTLNKYKEFDVTKTPDYPKVKVQGVYLVPVGVYKNVSDLKLLIEKADGVASKFQRVYQEFLTSMFGYGGSASRIEIEKLLDDKTFFHFKHNAIDLFLTKDSSIDDLCNYSERSVIIIENAQIRSLYATGLNICLGNVGFKIDDLSLRSSLLIASDPDIECNHKGNITKLAKREWLSHNVTANNVNLKYGIFVGTLNYTENVYVENGAIIKSNIGHSKQVHVRGSRLSNVRLGSQHSYILRSILCNCDFNVKTLNIKNSKISNRSLHSQELEVSITHPVGLTDAVSPLLPPLKLVSSSANKLAVVYKQYIADPLYFNLTDSHSKIAETLKGWIMTGTVDTTVLNPYERRELAALIYSRMDLLQKLNNLNNAKNEWTSRDNLSGHIPFKGFSDLPYNDCDYEDDYGIF